MRNVARVLVETRKVDIVTAQEAVSRHDGDTDAVWHEFVKNGVVTEEEVFQALARVYNYEFVDIREVEIEGEALSKLTPAFCREERIIPIEIRNEFIFVGTDTPNNFQAIDEVAASVKYTPTVKVVTPTALQEAIDRYFRADDEIEKLSEQLDAAGSDDEEEEPDTFSGNEESPIVRFANLLILQAIQDRASDIHVEPGAKGMRIRYRIDGVLHIVNRVEKSSQAGLTSRLKIMSDIDIAEKRKPQDGRFSIKYQGKSIDLRVVTLPTVYGEKIVMRILAHDDENRSIDTIQMSQANKQKFLDAVSKPQGMVLVTGPTGSGKALRIDTKLPTPEGFTTMKDVQVGDILLDSQNNPTVVVKVSEIDEDPDLYRITLDNGQVIYADCNHQWFIARQNSSEKFIIKNRKELNCYLNALKTVSTLYSNEDMFTVSQLFEILEEHNLNTHVSSEEVIKASLDYLGTPFELTNSGGIYYSARLMFSKLIERFEERFLNVEDEELVVSSTEEIVEEFFIRNSSIKSFIPVISTNGESKSSRNLVEISKIEKIAPEDEDFGAVKCITVDSPDSSYLCGDNVVTHNSTTLYTALAHVAQEDVSVVTVEDPVEKRMEGIDQIQINAKAGNTISNILKYILRSDPDIVFIGEIRDQETAKIAIDASMTGHLVLSTLHTNGAPDAAARLVEMGVEPYLVGSSVSCIIAQRLSRRLCEDCKQVGTVEPEVYARTGGALSGTVFYVPVGCKQCSNIGYKGRIALTEVLVVDEEVDSVIIAGGTASAIRKVAEAKGMISLQGDGWDKVRQGLTTVEEVLRVTTI